MIDRLLKNLWRPRGRYCVLDISYCRQFLSPYSRRWADSFPWICFSWIHAGQDVFSLLLRGTLPSRLPPHILWFLPTHLSFGLVFGWRRDYCYPSSESGWCAQACCPGEHIQYPIVVGVGFLVSVQVYASDQCIFLRIYRPVLALSFLESTNCV